MTRRAVATALVSAAFLAVPIVSASSPKGARTTTEVDVARTACGRTERPPPSYAHVVWIWMENQTFRDVIGNRNAPFETRLARSCATASNYHEVGSPSLPNYLGATSGSTHGIGDDDPPSAHPLEVDNVFRQVRAAGGTAKSYAESMPENCTLHDKGRYAVRHNPATYYVGDQDRGACARDDVPLGQPKAGALRRDLDADALPTFSFVVPDVCHDTHDCSVRTGDDWLRRWIPVLVGSKAYRAGATVVFVVWDEDTPMPFLAIGPSVRRGTVIGRRIDHYSLLRTTEEMLGIPRFLGEAANAPSMREALHA